MKYLSNFNNMSENLTTEPVYKSLNRREWDIFIRKIINFDTSKLSIFDGFNFEIRKTKQGEELIDYVVVYIDDNPIFIYETDDEYYGLFIKSTYIKCDQIDGVVIALNDLNKKV
jgi:hypothetical protein